MTINREKNLHTDLINKYFLLSVSLLFHFAHYGYISCIRVVFEVNYWHLISLDIRFVKVLMHLFSYVAQYNASAGMREKKLGVFDAFTTTLDVLTNKRKRNYSTFKQ